MKLDAIRARAAEIAASGVAPVCLRYRSAYGWSLGETEDLDARYWSDYVKTEMLAAELTGRGVVVVGILFEGKSYRDWLAGRPDSRELRLEWARERATVPGPHAWRFALGDPAPLELASPDVRAAYGKGAGWAANVPSNNQPQKRPSLSHAETEQMRRDFIVGAERAAGEASPAPAVPLPEPSEATPSLRPDDPTEFL